MEVWPDVWPSFRLFQAMCTQWRQGPGGPCGLDYGVLPWVMKVYGTDDEVTAFSDIRVMERAALDVIHRKGE